MVEGLTFQSFKPKQNIICILEFLAEKEMKQKILFLPLLALVLTFTQCQNKPKTAPTESMPGPVSDDHNAFNSLDWEGTYQGVLPCADCEGIETTLALSREGTYDMKTEYLGEEDALFEEEGTFSWNTEGNTITLSNGESGKRQYFVGENTLTRLDQEGNKIMGPLAENYVLRRIPASELSTPELSGIRWELVELGEKPIENSGGRETIHLVFSTDEGTVSGFAGCNGFRGHFETKGSHQITLSNLISTKMACPELETETALMQALSEADRYEIHRNTLSLLNVDGAPLAKFEKTSVEKQ